MIEVFTELPLKACGNDGIFAREEILAAFSKKALFPSSLLKGKNNTVALLIPFKGILKSLLVAVFDHSA
jgi:hypothetical protein